jgi:hypothetical protein
MSNSDRSTDLDHSVQTRPDTRKGSRAADYKTILDRFSEGSRTRRECIQYLQSIGYSLGQARNAVYRYRTGKMSNSEN